MGARRPIAMLVASVLLAGVQVGWANTLVAPPTVRAYRNRFGEEVVLRDARNMVRHLPGRNRLAQSRADPRQADPDLEPGFPVQTLHTGGGYHGGPAIHTLVGEIDGDLQLEIIVTALATGPVYAWNHDGSSVPGWPVAEAGAGYPAILQDLPQRRAVVVGYVGTGLAPSPLSVYSGDGNRLPGWPITTANWIATPPGAADIDPTSADEIFVEEEDRQFHAYRLNATILLGWPQEALLAGQDFHTPAFADLDGDGDLEIVTATGPVNDVARLYAYHHTGAIVTGFPINFVARADVFPAIGDVDGDGSLEIVVVVGDNWVNYVLVLSSSGIVKRWIRLTDVAIYGTAPALADLDGDRVPEIVVLTESFLEVFYGDGRRFPGWPVYTGGCAGHSAPVVGDVDGDPQQEIVVTIMVCGYSVFGAVHVYDSDGRLHPRFPKALPLGFGAVPAIADIDRDGRNEIVVCGNYWDGYTGYYDKCWAYDLGGGRHGKIEWGQFGGNAAHVGRYPVPAWTAAVALYNPATSTFFIRNANNAGPASTVFAYGPPGLNWVPIIGDWNGDRIETVGLYEPATGIFFLKNTNSAGPADLVFAFGPGGAGWIPLVGDWNGDGIDTVGAYNPSSGVFYLRNTNSAGPADLAFPFGPGGAGWIPLVGDWNRDGPDTVGAYDPTTGVFYLRNSNTAGPADLAFAFGPGGAGWTPLVGDWNGDGIDTIGLYRLTTGVFYLRNANSAGVADATFPYGPPGMGWTPLAGDWDGL